MTVLSFPAFTSRVPSLQPSEVQLAHEEQLAAQLLGTGYELAALLELADRAGVSLPEFLRHCVRSEYQLHGDVSAGFLRECIADSRREADAVAEEAGR